MPDLGLILGHSRLCQCHIDLMLGHFGLFCGLSWPLLGKSFDYIGIILGHIGLCLGIVGHTGTILGSCQAFFGGILLFVLAFVGQELEPYSADLGHFLAIFWAILKKCYGPCWDKKWAMLALCGAPPPGSL